MRLSIISFKPFPHGLTLLEVLCAMSVLTIGIFGYMAMTTLSIKTNASGYSTGAGKALVESKLMQLKYLNYDDTLLTHTGNITSINPEDGLTSAETAIIGASRIETDINYAGLNVVASSNDGPYRFTRYYTVCSRKSSPAHCKGYFPKRLGAEGQKRIDVTVFWEEENDSVKYVSHFAYIYK
jgi:prepilin-type N-terminal cleavage/methylation domain-containing protein